MSTKSPLPPRLYFSYSQFLVYDAGVKSPGSYWTEDHCAQGFARRESTVSFATILEFGHADVSCARTAFQHDEEYDRVISVPFVVFTGKVIVEGPEELRTGRAVDLQVGNYRVIAAQRIVGDEKEVIDLFFEGPDVSENGSADHRSRRIAQSASKYA